MCALSDLSEARTLLQPEKVQGKVDEVEEEEEQETEGVEAGSRFTLDDSERSSFLVGRTSGAGASFRALLRFLRLRLDPESPFSCA